MSNLGESPANDSASPGAGGAGAAGSNGAAVSAPGAQDRPDPRIGAVFGKYRILKMLGKGGMGTVYEGEDAALKRKVAVKFLPDDVLSKPDVIDRFMREAQVAGRLNHPNIIAIYDVGKDERGCYMVMELLHPGSASSYIKSKGLFHWLVATRIIADCCNALKIAHEANIVHRDIKPDNILFSTSGVVKLVDFGLVKLMEDEAHLTQTGMVVGTPLYMSPEQASNKAMDARSDLYSLGATYYALLTGRPPFLGAGIPQILLSHVSDPTPDPRGVVPSIPESCVRVLKRAMEKKREARYQTAAEMGADLEVILSGISGRNQSIFAMEESTPAPNGHPNISGPSAAVAGQSVDSVQNTLGSGTNGASTAKKSSANLSRRSLLAIGGLGALGLVGGGILTMRARRLTSADSGNPAPGAAPDPAAAVLSGPPIKVGVLHSLSGSLAVSEHPLADASQLAIEEINSRGGLLGRPVQAIVADGKSEVTADSAFTHAAEKLLTKDKVAVVFGGYGSAGRKVIRPYFEQYDQLLFYPAQYEGLEESQNIVYTGATPNQLAIPAVQWCVESLKAKRFYVVGTDGLRARAISAIVEDRLKELGGEVVGTHFALVGEYQFAPLIKKIRHAKPDILLNMLVGDSIVAFFKTLVGADITPDELPVLSFTLGENELAQLGTLSLAGHYVARTRFHEGPSAVPGAFAQAFRKKYGEHRAVSEGMEAAYYGVLLWAAAVRRAGSDDVDKVRAALKEREYDLGGVLVRVDASNQHTWKVFELGKITKDNRIQIIKPGDAPMPPIPFPGPRTRGEWQSFSEQLYTQWGENWANPLKPRVSTGKKGK